MVGVHSILTILQSDCWLPSPVSPLCARGVSRTCPAVRQVRHGFCIPSIDPAVCRDIPPCESPVPYSKCMQLDWFISSLHTMFFNLHSFPTNCVSNESKTEGVGRIITGAGQLQDSCILIKTICLYIKSSGASRAHEAEHIRKQHFSAFGFL